MKHDSPNIAYLREKLGSKILASHVLCGDETIVIPREGLQETFRFLKDDSRLNFNVLMDLTVVDYLGKKEPRFEVVYHLVSLRAKHRLRVKVAVPAEEPEVESLTPLWKGANWLEREAWDMFGIRFRGHPCLKRVLLYEEFQGHPLRKDYPVNQCQPLVPERDVEGTFVDQASKNKLLLLKQKLTPQA